jgi:hypothetical protein
MSAKKSHDNGFDGLVAIQLCTKSWPGIVNLTKEDLGMEQVPEFFHLGNKKLYPAEWRQAFNRKISEGRRVLNENTYDFVLEWVRCSPKGRLARTLEKLAQVQREYLALADEFCEKYDAIRDEWKAFCESKQPAALPQRRRHHRGGRRDCRGSGPESHPERHAARLPGEIRPVDGNGASVPG